MSIYEKILRIQQELKVPKKQYNKFGDYNYRSCEDIVESLKPHLAKEKLFMSISDTVEQVGEYWNMSLDDISDVMKAYKEEKDSRLEEYACMVYSQAVLNASAILSPKDFPKSVQEAFPKLFGGSQPIQQDCISCKSRYIAVFLMF